ncbi:hypothetical protein BR93DRAFT_78799 [Coniochaeta sp. PMI_546]|nr:hypothetical protein BR93DRAFT_78799 [Coniochaeta sp. PMI_546]
MSLLDRIIPRVTPEYDVVSEEFEEKDELVSPKALRSSLLLYLRRRLGPIFQLSGERRCLSWSSCDILYSFTIAVLLVAVIFLGRNPPDIACARQLSPYSPYLESGDLEYIEFTDQNHFMQPSIYRGPPSHELEDAWTRLWRFPMVQLPENMMGALNKTPAHEYAHANAKYGGEVLGFLDVFHQLHCLNMIRQFTNRDRYDYSHESAFNAPEDVVRGHVDHCIETLRKAIMCTSEVTPMVFPLDSSRPGGRKSDFNIKRKCRNYEKIQRWALDNHADM